MFEIECFSASRAREWNDFVAHSKNGTFLFDRNYMDYHAKRFSDHSLVFSDSSGIFAILPAHMKERTLISHGGLTYGGLITDGRATAEKVSALFTELNAYLTTIGVEHVVYKAIPWIYHRQPSEEDLYALYYVCRARLMARDVSATIMLNTPLPWRRDHRYGARKAAGEGLTVERSNDYEGFWKILTDNLTAKYGALPVHSLEEIRLLYSRFPQQIRLYTVVRDGQMLAGTVLYLCGQVAHAQYISANGEGKHLHAIDLLFDYILHHELEGFNYFDFGKSTENLGKTLNATLASQKEGFGARAVCYDWYEWDIPVSDISHS